MNIYDVSNNGKIDVYEIGNMIADTYRSINVKYDPSGTDRAAFMRTITRKGLNEKNELKLTKDDIEGAVKKFL